MGQRTSPDGEWWRNPDTRLRKLEIENCDCPCLFWERTITIFISFPLRTNERIFGIGVELWSVCRESGTGSGSESEGALLDEGGYAVDDGILFVFLRIEPGFHVHSEETAEGLPEPGTE